MGLAADALSLGVGLAHEDVLASAELRCVNVTVMTVRVVFVFYPDLAVVVIELS